MSENLPNNVNDFNNYETHGGANPAVERVAALRPEHEARIAPPVAYAGYGTAGYGNPSEGAVVIARPGDDNYADNSLRQFFAMLLRRRAIFLSVLLMALGATMLYLMLTPPIYVASATMQVTAADGSNNDQSSNSLVVNTLPGAATTIDTQLNIIQSDQVRDTARKSLSPDVRAKLAGYSDTEIEPVAETNLIEVKVSSHDPYAAAQYANAICDAYIQLSRAQNRRQLQQALDYVTTQKDKVGKKLNAARTQLQQYKERYGIFNIQSEAGSVVATAHALEDEQQKTSAERYVTQAEINRVSQLIPNMPKIQQWPGSTTTRPEIAAMKSQITQLELQRLELLQKYRADRPEIQTVDRQIQSIRDQMQGQAQTEIASWSNTPNPIRSQLENQLVTMQVKDWSLQAKEAALAQASQRANARLALLPTRERQMEEMSMNLEALVDSYTALNEKQEGLRMMQEARTANASKLFPAEPPNHALERVARFLASALLVGILLALALSALVDWLDDGVYGEVEAKMVSQLPILAQIPQIGKEAQKSMMTAADASTDDWQLAHLRENFRMLRTMIALSSPAWPTGHALTAPNGYPANGNGANGSVANGNGASGHVDGNGAAHAPSLAKSSPFGTSAIRSVVITSSLPNEGKSVSATNLAIAAALSGERVVLVDCDLRHPGLQEFFDLPNDIGLTSVVSGACTLEEALQSTRIPTLKVLTTGPLIAEPLQVLNSPGARALFDKLEESSDFVVIDTPPALVFAEAQVIAAMTDAMLLVISSQEAKKREVARTRELFDQSGLIPLGAVLNKIPLGAEGYYYGRYN